MDTYVMMNGVKFDCLARAAYCAKIDHLESAEVQIYNSENNELLGTQMIKSENDYSWIEYGIFDYNTNPKGDWYKGREDTTYDAYAVAEEVVKKDRTQSCLIETLNYNWDF